MNTEIYANLSTYPVDIIQVANIPVHLLDERFESSDSDSFTDGFEEPAARRVDAEFLNRFHANLTQRLDDPREDAEKLGLAILKYYAVRDAWLDVNPDTDWVEPGMDAAADLRAHAVATAVVSARSRSRLASMRGRT